jgi:hypothetical protein
MWALENRTPFEAERSWVQDKHGVQHWIVVVKATYDIGNGGSLALAETQEPVVRVPVHRGDPATASLVYEADIVGRKVATDILVNGTAYAPAGRPVPSVEVRVRVAGIDKALLVTGNRLWYGKGAGVSMTSPQPFESMPLTYERAFGGFDRTDEDPALHRLYDTNPAGTGFATRAKHLHESAVPNVEYPAQRIREWTDHPAPAGLGPIDRWWSPRRQYAGTYDEQWFQERLPLWAIDFDDRYHQSAPADQQAGGFLRGGEPVELSNLTPGGVLRFALPKVHLGFTTFFGRDARHHQGQLDTVIIEPDQNRLMLVWQSLLACHHDVDYLDISRVFLKTDLSPSMAGSKPLSGARSL